MIIRSAFLRKPQSHLIFWTPLVCCTYFYTRLFDAAAAVRLWQWCVKHHHGVVKVLAKGRATSETQQGEIDRSMHTPLYRPARFPLCPAHFGVTTNYIVSPKHRNANNRRSSVNLYCPDQSSTSVISRCHFAPVCKISLKDFLDWVLLDPLKTIRRFVVLFWGLSTSWCGR